MPRAIRNAADNVAAASQEVDNTAVWASIVLSKISKLIDKIEQDKALNLEIEIPLGDNIAKLFGKEHLTIDGKVPVIKANVKILWPA